MAILNEKGIHARMAPGLIETTWTIGAPTRVNPVRILVPEEDAARALALLGLSPSVLAGGPSRFAIATVVAMLVVVLLLFGWVLARSLVVP